MLSEKEKPIWIWEFNRRMDLLRIYSFAKSYHKYKIRFFYYNNKGNTDFYWDEKIADKQADAIFKKSINSDFLVREFKKIKTIINEFNQLIKKLKRQNFLAMSDEELYKNYLLFHKMVYRGGLCAVFIMIFVYKAEPFLQLELEKKLADQGYGFIFYEENLKHDNLYEFNLSTRIPRQVTKNISVVSFVLSPDGKTAAAGLITKSLIATLRWKIQNVSLFNHCRPPFLLNYSMTYFSGTFVQVY